MIDIRTALNDALHQLDPNHDQSRLETELLLGYVLNKNRAFIFAHPEFVLSPAELEAYQKLIAQRRMGIPIAYLTGYREFWSLNLKVSKDTLIPRHETELLVEQALELIPDTPDTCILDLGTGSGAIALAIASEKPHWKIIAVDFSEGALKVAQENAQILGVTNVAFYRSFWFDTLPKQQYHAILSNPPYIAEDDPHLNQGDIQFEPLSALASGQDGLADLQYIIQHSYECLYPDGLLLLEHGFNQKLKLEALLKESGYKNVRSWQDIQGHDRVSGGWRP
ncbi:peptide chain release factor N(5)-glutamine methyltransferase [Legionella worsleiensis]|uniref:Release factor glutamine methyltransferase n=1 Tax=Legionella worsleiensis TaxID=45076 RepID=A0A0W1AHA1_9GAMM|nr:peptide chain release factor N(5)-glutamine methyltransferase [Legionella worsleiensis]KTD80751.1 protein methyltransferase HemK [Legionella worsleiensis]STY32671.1 HemK protein [Legionella worsleiensis]